MSKSNDKQNRKDGTTTSASIKLPNPVKSYNNPTSAFSYPDSQKIEEQVNRRD